MFYLLNKRYDKLLQLIIRYLGEGEKWIEWINTNGKYKIKRINKENINDKKSLIKEIK